MLHSKAIRFIYVHKLETLYLRYGVKFHSGVIWGQRGVMVIFSKNDTFATEYMGLYLCVAWCIHVTFKYASA